MFYPMRRNAIHSYLKLIWLPTVATVPGATSQQLPSLQGLPLRQESGGAAGRGCLNDFIGCHVSS